ncbi:MAG: AEC family transporter [Pseudomonadota bacterium]|uniref:AEC family transporter n=1 Tax=Caldimonas aquatica TaxID=376175 RepID=A0ABY6MVT1_9BURK|nr:AEC family transporter [Schlegelella aquatica]UZD56123.1 AEC family transporter [Schlegelella aquatica]
MSDALLLLPDFLLIVSGFLVCRHTPLGRSVWDGVERLVYYLLFPVLLFHSIVRSPLAFGETLPLVVAGLGVVGTGIAMSYALKAVPGVDPVAHASGAQVAFRFNSYVALALADKLAGPAGVAWTAMLVAVCVPLCNFGAVYPLARQGGHRFWQEVLRNPLILSTLAGLTANLLGLRVPEPVAPALQRMGQAALALGLMTVGAGLQLGGLWAAPRLAAALLGIRHVVLPLVAFGLIALLRVPAAQQPVVVAFAAMPTASSAYVLALRMGGNGPYVAGLVTVSTLLGMASIPLWLAAWRHLA